MPGRAQAEALGVRFYERLDELPVHPDIDGVIIDTPTTMHRNVMIPAARAGKHIFTEKVIAPALHVCNEILTEIKKAGVKLTVSLPRLNAGYTQAIQSNLKHQLLGELTLVRTRLAHNGAIRTQGHPEGWLPSHFFNLEQCGGGAMIDLGCHPMYLARLFLGPHLPETVRATYSSMTGREVEDNAVAVLHYPQGAIGVVEASFVNHFSPFSIEVYGTEGSLFYGTPENTLRIRSAVSSAGNSEDWYVQENFPEDRPSAFQQWVTHIHQGTVATENIQLAVDLTMLMEAANLSARTKQIVRLDSLSQ